jgi:hypothetical protein
MRHQNSWALDIAALSPAAWFRRGDWTVTGSGISQWNDSSGNGRHLLQGTDAARPAGQSDGSVLFNGTSHFLKTAPFTLNQPTWVVMALKQVSWTGNDRIFDGNAQNACALFQGIATPGLRIYAGSSLSQNSELAVGVAGVVSAVFNGASSSLRVNNTAATTGNPGTNNMGGFTLAANGANTEPSNIQVYEVALFPIAPSAAQQDRAIAAIAGLSGVSL